MNEVVQSYDNAQELVFGGSQFASDPVTLKMCDLGQGN